MNEPIELGKPLAEGRTAVIYPWKDGWVLKLFHTWVSTDNVEYEARINRAVYAAGIAVPKVGKIIQIDDRLGLPYERIAGNTMGQMMASKPWLIVNFAKSLAKLHAKIHDVEAPADIPEQRDRLAYKITSVATLDDNIRKTVLTDLERMSQHRYLCHGDFHPGNVMMEKGYQAKVIDWVDATSGAPLADVARTSIILMGANQMHERTNWVEKIFVDWFHKIYLQEYFLLCPADIGEYKRWLPIVAAGRMSENIHGLNPWLLNQVLKGL